MIKRYYVKHMACRKYWISRNCVLLILISFSFRSLQVTQEQDLCLNLSFNPQSLLNEHMPSAADVLGLCYSLMIFFPEGGVFYILSNPTSNAHLYQWRTEMYPQEKRHKYNTLSFLNNRSDSKRFSSAHPIPTLFSAAGLGLGWETEQGSQKAGFLPKEGQNFQDGRRLDENDRGLSHYLNQSWKGCISPLEGP